MYAAFYENGQPFTRCDDTTSNLWQRVRAGPGVGRNLHRKQPINVHGQTTCRSESRSAAVSETDSAAQAVGRTKTGRLAGESQRGWPDLRSIRPRQAGPPG